MVPLVRRVVPLKTWQLMVAELVEDVKNAYNLRTHVPARVRVEGNDEDRTPKFKVCVVDAGTVIADVPVDVNGRSEFSTFNPASLRIRLFA